MANKKHDVYMPLMIGDWYKGTRGMKAEVRGVYLSLLMYQWDNGFIPSDMEELSLIEPEVGKVWVSLKCKFQESAPGKLQNKKMEEVRGFFSKQSENGKKGGRPPKPKRNPNHNPNTNLHNDIDIEHESVFDSENKGGVGGLPIPTQTECEIFFQQCDKTREDGERFFHHYQAQGWITGNGQPVTDWASLAQKWILNPKDFNSKNQSNGTGKIRNLDGTINWTEVNKSADEFLRKSGLG